MIFKFGQYRMDVDVEKTRAFYHQADRITDGCDCQDCRNYEAWALSLDAEPKGTLEKMGVCIEKAAEVYVNFRREDGKLFYGGFYHLCGKIIHGDDEWSKIAEEAAELNEHALVDLAEGFRVLFTEETDLVEEGFPTPVIQMEISADIPWVLSE